MWVPWHALAVAIAELCVFKDPTVMSRYWSVVDQVYRRSRFMIADSRHGMLWKPLERLMAQAETRRQELLGPDLTSQFLSQVSFNDLSTGLVPQQPESHHVASLPLDLEATINRQTNPSLTEPPPSFEPVPWPNVWEAMDMSSTNFEGSIDTGWLSYESFIENVYDSADSMFLPR